MRTIRSGVLEYPMCRIPHEWLSSTAPTRRHIASCPTAMGHQGQGPRRHGRCRKFNNKELGATFARCTASRTGIAPRDILAQCGVTPDS